MNTFRMIFLVIVLISCLLTPIGHTSEASGATTLSPRSMFDPKEYGASLQRKAAGILREFMREKARVAGCPYYDMQLPNSVIDWWRLSGGKFLGMIKRIKGYRSLEESLAWIKNRDNLALFWKECILVTTCPCCKTPAPNTPSYIIGMSEIYHCPNCNHEFKQRLQDYPYMIDPFPLLFSPKLTMPGNKIYKIDRYVETLVRLLKNSGLWQKDCRIVDIGTGDGTKMIRIVEKGFPGCIYGYDPDTIRIKKAQAAAQRHNVNPNNFVAASTMEDFLKKTSIKPGAIDAFVLFQALEHLPDVQGTLGQLRPLLSEDGVIIALDVPNHASTNILVSFFGPDQHTFSFWPDHNNHFTPQSLSALAKYLGLTPEFHRTDHLIELHTFLSESTMQNWTTFPLWQEPLRIETDENKFLASINRHLTTNHQRLVTFYPTLPQAFSSMEEFLDHGFSWQYKNPKFQGSYLAQEVVAPTKDIFKLLSQVIV